MTTPRFFLRCIAEAALVAVCAAALQPSPAHADETCMSPYMPKITGQEDYVYVWTLGVDGLGDGSDKLVTIGADPASKDYGKVISSTSVGGRHEAHHGGFTDDRRELWVSGIDDGAIFVFDVASDPAHPKLEKTISTFETDSGLAGPHGFYALPGRMLVPGLSNAKDRDGRTGVAEYSNAGKFIRTVWMPPDAEYGYDARVQPRLDRMLTSSFTGWKNYMRPLGDLMKDPEAMKHFGSTMVAWDFHAMKPLQVMQVPGAPLEIRWALQPQHDYAFSAAALTSKLWLIEAGKDGKFAATAVADIGDPSKTPLAVDISLSLDDRYLFVSTFMDGKVHVFDVSDPHHPKVVLEQQIGKQVNMVSESWDGRRVYFTSSLLANWDKTGADNEQFLKAYRWDGKTLTPAFTVDFTAEKLGRPHHMHFGSKSFYSNQVAAAPAARPGS
ncbi:MAG TPA: selenium-binding protein SBP56-related protein [Candidatus Binatia bacterium]|jgi:selenium-binding protein 1